MPSRSYVVARPSLTGQWFVYSEYPGIGGLQHTLSRNCGRLHGHPLNSVFATVGRVKVDAFRNNPILRVLPPSYWRCRALSWLTTLLTAAFRTLCPRRLMKLDGVIGRAYLRILRTRWSDVRVHALCRLGSWRPMAVGLGLMLMGGSECVALRLSLSVVERVRCATSW